MKLNQFIIYCSEVSRYRESRYKVMKYSNFIQPKMSPLACLVKCSNSNDLQWRFQ